MPDGRLAWWFAAGVAGGSLAALALLFGVRALLDSEEPVAAMGPPRFVEETDTSGIDHVYGGEFAFFVGGGVAVLDCDGDGRQDLYLAGGANPASVYRNVSSVGGPLRFIEVADLLPDAVGVTGAYPLDIDGDGPDDLAVLRVGENVLLRGLGDCRFERANEALRFHGGDAWTVGFAAAWEDGESLPTLAFGNYLTLDETGTPTYACEDNLLVRPDGAFTYGEPTPLTPSWCTLSMLFSDWNRSGRRDLRTANDRHYYVDGEEQLWRIPPGEAPRLYTHEEGWRSLQIWGMGIASHDLTHDGRPEVFITSQADNKLQTLDEGAGGPAYHDIAIRRGATAHRPFTEGAVLPSTAWHPEFDDVNNDGFIDLYISKGNVEAMDGYASEDPSNLLLGQPDGSFVEAAPAAGILSLGRSRGAALADFNLDGMLDLIEVNRRETVRVWRNVGWGDALAPASMGNWIALQLEQPAPNRDAIGSWIEVRVGGRLTEREVTVGGGHAGGESGWLHFGLGTADSAEVRVVWPDGETGPWVRLEANTFATVRRGDRRPVEWIPAESLAEGNRGAD